MSASGTASILRPGPPIRSDHPVNLPGYELLDSPYFYKIL
jgi:hypothetical protein